MSSLFGPPQYDPNDTAAPVELEALGLSARVLRLPLPRPKRWDRGQFPPPVPREYGAQPSSRD